MNKRMQQLQSLWRSFAVKLSVLVAVLIVVPVIVFSQMRAADAEKTVLLQRAVQQEGRLIAESLKPDLKAFQNESAGRLNYKLSTVGDDATNVRLLFRPDNAQNPGGFFYIAGNPDNSEDYLERDRVDLLATGILDQLPATCAVGQPLGVRYTNPAGSEEILTSITPVNLPSGCWAVVTSHASEDFLRSSVGRPYWKTAEAQLAMVIYLLMVVLVVSLFVDIWHNVRRFGAVARAIRVRREGDQSFASRNRIPELSWVAEEFDRLVLVLDESASAIREAAQENAHAFKTPLAVITQSIEPLKRAVPQGDARAQRALDLIARSVARLDAAVSAARRIEQVTAELIDPPREPVDVSALLSGMLEAYRQSAEMHALCLECNVQEGIVVNGSEDLFERIIDNLLENAVSFAPPGTTISVSLTGSDRTAELIVADQGPGVDPGDLERIFERYYSGRGANDNIASNFGIGLWIVRRNVEGIGGSVTATNRDGGGLMISIKLPAAPAKPNA